jgi:hypothetical protein
MHRGNGRLAWPTIAWLSLLVSAFTVVSLLVTATGTARFVTSMRYDAAVRYAVGVVFDLTKGSLLIIVLAFWARRSLPFAAIFALIWTGLATFSCLATHATVTTAISATERIGTCKMEVRGNSQTALAAVEQQLAALSRPAVPRPAKTVREELASTSVPPGAWKDSNECNGIKESVYFQHACTQVVRLRRELVAAQDYERLSVQAFELRKGLAGSPIVATSDALPESFDATLGRVLHVDGKEGVALLLAAIVELMSAFGFAGLRSLARSKVMGTSSQPVKLSEVDSSATARSVPRERGTAFPKPCIPTVLPARGRVQASASMEMLNPPSIGRATLSDRSLPAGAPGGGRSQINAARKVFNPPSIVQPLPQQPETNLPILSPATVGYGGGMPQAPRPGEISNPPSNVPPMRLRAPDAGLPKPSPTRQKGRCAGGLGALHSHISRFVEECLQAVDGVSLAAKDLRAAYENWCAVQGHAPLSMVRLAAELRRRGYHKWKSNRVIRYRDLQFVA